MKKLEPLHIIGKDVKWYIVPVENSMEIIQKIKNRTTM